MEYAIRRRTLRKWGLTLFTSFVLLVGSAHAADIVGRVVSVADGDTITVLDASHQQFKIRLSGIDAPEKRQAFGERAKQHLADLVFAKTVLVTWDKHDRYGRVIGRVLAPECDQASCRYSLDAGLEQIRAGVAWHYKQYQRDQALDDRIRYATAEDDARASHRGLWQETDAVPPWEFRHGRPLASHTAPANINLR